LIYAQKIIFCLN